MIDGKRERARSAHPGRQGEGDVPARFGIGTWLANHGVTADAITAIGILFAAGTAVSIGLGAFYWAIGLLITGGLMDTLDGVVAKAANTASPRGAFFDSVADRIADGLMFGGLAFYFLDGHNPRLAILPIAILAMAATVSYERAKAESLGFTARGGLMERAERLILFGGSLTAHVLLIPLLIALLVLTTGTACGRFLRVWRQASGVPVGATARSEQWRAQIDARWRTWRTAAPSRSVRRSRRDVVPLTTRLRGVLGSERALAGQRREKTRDRAARARRRRPVANR